MKIKTLQKNLAKNGHHQGNYICLSPNTQCELIVVPCAFFGCIWGSNKTCRIVLDASITLKNVQINPKKKWVRYQGWKGVICLTIILAIQNLTLEHTIFTLQANNPILFVYKTFPMQFFPFLLHFCSHLCVVEI